MNLKSILPLVLIYITLIFLSCKEKAGKNGVVTMESKALTKSLYGKTSDGKEVEKYALQNDNGMTIDIITYGGIITSWTAPDKEGQYKNIVLGYDSLAQYERNNP